MRGGSNCIRRPSPSEAASPPERGRGKTVAGCPRRVSVRPAGRCFLPSPQRRLPSIPPPSPEPPESPPAALIEFIRANSPLPLARPRHVDDADWPAARSRGGGATARRRLLRRLSPPSPAPPPS
uniref:Uncharacterized protein n=1 Tax=Sphaerodactylus townsendi TaxID=933632 RepID=A0ACB8FZC9_9SAUR